MRSPLLCWAFLAVLARIPTAESFAQQSATEGAQPRPHRYFTVPDSIEMSRFDTTEAGPLFSPDHEFFSVVTSRGVIDTDSIESTLWVFRAAEVRHLLDSGQSGGALQGKAVFKLAQVPRNDYSTPYAPVISSVRWSQDSNALLFLGQDGGGERRLYRVDVRSGAARELTPKGEDVSLYAVQGRTIVYLVVSPKQNIWSGRPINADALDITGEPLAMIMPQIDDSALYRELWVLRNGNRWKLRRDGKYSIRLANHFPDVLSISPDEKSLAVLVPSSTVPSLWESYEPENNYPRLRPNHPELTTPFNFIRPMQYTVFDVTTGKTRFTLSAPHAYALGYVQEDTAVWSADSRRLLLTNTFLPLTLADEEQRPQRQIPCACSIVDLDRLSTSCIAWSRYRRTGGSSLASAQFGPDADEVILGFNAASNGSSQERYIFEDDVWQRAKAVQNYKPNVQESIPSASTSTLSTIIEIKETPNEPPALFAADQKSGQIRKLWDPNPQLSLIDLGEITEFRWVDNTGYKWLGQLVKPPDYVPGHRYPLVIQTYGFSGGFVSDGIFPSASAVRPLAAIGIMVLQMPRRTDHYGTPDEAPDQLRGMQSAIARLVEENLIDPKKVGVAGFSHTSYHVESAIVTDPTLFAAATIADGMDGSYMQYLYSVSDSTANIQEGLYGAKPFGSGLKLWLDRAPGFNLDKIQSPVRIETYSFPSVLTQWETYASLLNQHKPVDLVYFPHADHLLQKPLERLASQQGNVDWFRFWLKGEEDPDAQKRDQYSLWERLRDQRSTENRAKQNSSD